MIVVVGHCVVVVVVVVVVGGHGPQSPGHVEQFSAGPHSPSPHTQLQAGDPPVQLQAPALQSLMTCWKHADLAFPLRPLAATTSLQALRPHGEAAFATGATTQTPSASSVNPASILRTAMDEPPASGEAARVPPQHPLTSVPATRRRGTWSLRLPNEVSHRGR